MVHVFDALRGDFGIRTSFEPIWHENNTESAQRCENRVKVVKTSKSVLMSPKTNGDTKLITKEGREKLINLENF